MWVGCLWGSDNCGTLWEGRTICDSEGCAAPVKITGMATRYHSELTISEVEYKQLVDLVHDSDQLIGFDSVSCCIDLHGQEWQCGSFAALSTAGFSK